MVEFWSTTDFGYPKILKFKHKSDTDLYEYVKSKATPWGASFSQDGQLFATMASDRKVRIFRVATGKLYKVYDESLETMLSQQEGTMLDAMELGRRKAGEMELLRSPSLRHENVVFDESSNFVMYPTMVGIKCVNILTNVVSRIIGKGENMRCLRLTLFQGTTKAKGAAATTLALETAVNPGLNNTDEDPTLFCTGFKKSRFFLFSRREPSDDAAVDVGRDVFNLKPTREEQLAATGVLTQRKLSEQVTMHTSMGDITINLFLHECPKTVENFVTHCRDGYFNGIIFHRVIDKFMVQTGDPDGNGTGGESIWGAEFEDEFHSTLKHDRPYTVSMANGGANTNGSQFFITLLPTPWLDNKHTVFGRVSKGMETVQTIGSVKVDKDDKPFEEIKIINVSVK
jgi:peptidylprolyl isomerase domain and WD repeat-containing protein 1